MLLSTKNAVVHQHILHYQHTSEELIKCIKQFLFLYHMLELHVRIRDPHSHMLNANCLGILLLSQMFDTHQYAHSFLYVMSCHGGALLLRAIK